MLVIRDSWGVVIFESESYKEIVEFGKAYKIEQNLRSLEITKREGGFHSFI